MKGPEVSSVNSTNSRIASIKRAIKHGTTLTIVLALLGLLIGTAFGLRRADTHEARATIMVNPLDGNPFSTTGRGDDLINLVTEAQLVRSNAVAERVLSELDLDLTPAELLRGLDVSVPANSQIIELTYVSTDSEASARDRAQAFADQFLAFRQARAETLVDSQIAKLDEQIKEARAQQTRLSRELNALPEGSTDASVARSQLDSITSQLNQLRTRSSELRSSSLDPGQIVTPSAVIRPGVLQSWFAFSAAGALAGAALGLMIALIRARLDNRIHHVDDIALAGLQLMGVSTWRDTETITREMAEAPWQASVTQDYRDMRVNILTAQHQRPLVLVVATASDEQTGPVSALPLMLTMALSRLETILVDTLVVGITRTDVPTHPYLTDVLVADGDPTRAVDRIRPFASVIRSREDIRAEDLFLTPQMSAMLDHLRARAEIVVITAGSVNDARTRALVDIADALVVEVVESVSRYDDLARIADDRSPYAKKLLGAIFIEKRQPSNAPTVPEHSIDEESPDTEEPSKPQVSATRTGVV